MRLMRVGRSGGGDCARRRCGRGQMKECAAVKLSVVFVVAACWVVVI